MSQIKVMQRDLGFERSGGRKPQSAEQILHRNLLISLQASYAVATFDTVLACSKLSHGAALAYAYCLYLQRFQSPAAAAAGCHVCPRPEFAAADLNIDHLFILTSSVYGLWGSSRTLQLVTCPACGSRFLSTPVGEGVSRDVLACPFCRAASRYYLDFRVRAFFDDSARPEPRPPGLSDVFDVVEQFPSA